MRIRLNWVTLSLTAVLLAAIPAAASAHAWATHGGGFSADATVSTRQARGHSSPLRTPAPGSRTRGTAPASTPRGSARGGSFSCRSRSHPSNAVLPDVMPAAPCCGVAAAPAHACSATCRLAIWRAAGRGPPRASPDFALSLRSRSARSTPATGPRADLRTRAPAALAASHHPTDIPPLPAPIRATDRESARPARGWRAPARRTRRHPLTLRRTSVRPHPRVPEGGARWAVSPSPGGNS
jgi:hypothetical protein